jgi:predicted RNA-binding Zn-ribbon protein involved in translation (DUF1610 family)
MTLERGSKPTQDTDRWRELRRLRRMQLYVAVSMPVILVVFIGPLRTYAPLGIGLAILILVVTMARAATYPCPNCGQPFSRTKGRNGFRRFGSNCVHCGVSLGAQLSQKAEERSVPL